MNSIKEKHEITLESLADGDGLSLLQRVFYDLESFRPTQTQAHVTELSAKNFIKVAEELQKWVKAEGRDEQGCSVLQSDTRFFHLKYIFPRKKRCENKKHLILRAKNRVSWAKT